MLGLDWWNVRRNMSIRLISLIIQIFQMIHMSEYAYPNLFENKRLGCCCIHMSEQINTWTLNLFCQVALLHGSEFSRNLAAAPPNSSILPGDHQVCTMEGSFAFSEQEQLVLDIQATRTPSSGVLPFVWSSWGINPAYFHLMQFCKGGVDVSIPEAGLDLGYNTKLHRSLCNRGALLRSTILASIHLKLLTNISRGEELSY
jgi:hypothetical protein